MPPFAGAARASRYDLKLALTTGYAENGSLIFQAIKKPMETTSEVRDNPGEQRFELAIDGEMAVAVYHLDGDVITFEHTFVPEALRGRGLATRVVKAALDAARSRGLKVVPQCPTFAAYVKSHPESHDLLTADARAALGV
jgi:predicted GNAT family acetyltransferase